MFSLRLFAICCLILLASPVKEADGFVSGGYITLVNSAFAYIFDVFTYDQKPELEEIWNTEPYSQSVCYVDVCSLSENTTFYSDVGFIGNDVDDAVLVQDELYYYMDACYIDVCAIYENSTFYHDGPVEEDATFGGENYLAKFRILVPGRRFLFVLIITIITTVFMVSVMIELDGGLRFVEKYLTIDSITDSDQNDTKSDIQPATRRHVELDKLPLAISIAPELEIFRLMVSESNVKTFIENEAMSLESRQMALKLQFQLAKMTKCWVHMRLMRELAVQAYGRPWFKKEMLKNKQRFFLPATDEDSES